MKTQTKNSQGKLKPQGAKKLLVEGNKRFIQGKPAKRNLTKQVKETTNGQFPFAVVLSCIDSRVPAELLFDQGIGDIFNVRLAGNIVNKDALGSMEYSCKVAGSKLLVVLGHTSCGAVTAACKNVKLGNITGLLKKIQPALSIIKKANPKFSYEKAKDVNQVAVENVYQSIAKIRKGSKILASMEKEGAIKIIGAMYSVKTGKVKFLKA